MIYVRETQIIVNSRDISVPLVKRALNPDNYDRRERERETEERKGEEEKEKGEGGYSTFT